MASQKNDQILSYSFEEMVCLLSCPYPFPFGPQSVPRCRIFRFDSMIRFDFILLHTSCYFFDVIMKI